MESDASSAMQQIYQRLSCSSHTPIPDHTQISMCLLEESIGTPADAAIESSKQPLLCTLRPHGLSTAGHETALYERLITPSGSERLPKLATQQYRDGTKLYSLLCQPNQTPHIKLEKSLSKIT